MTEYIEGERAKLMLWMPAETKAKAKEIAAKHAITTTAALNILLDYGLEVHELLESQRNTAVAIVAAVTGADKR